MKTPLIFLACLLHGSQAIAADALPSWNDGPAKSAITDFVAKVTTEGPDFVLPAERIAVFDNDGCLWSEQPLYFQAFYISDRIKQLAPQHPGWKEREPFASVLKGDLKAVLAGGERALLEMAMATHAGITSDEFNQAVREWLKTARHPKTGRPYQEMVYQPMLELLAYLRGSGFKTFIVSGGGVDFMRVFAEETYGIPPEQVVGSSIAAKYEIRDGKAVIVKTADSLFIDDKAGKPVGIHQHIGRRPVFAAGNSDGDFEMLEWTTTGNGPRFGMLVHHDDAEREWAYDRESHIGKLAMGLDEGPDRGWAIVSMKNDWKRIHPDSE
jgi:phosphoglycolate phosphatase-like HAD superfamily hydrolase